MQVFDVSRDQIIFMKYQLQVLILYINFNCKKSINGLFKVKAKNKNSLHSIFMQLEYFI